MKLNRLILSALGLLISAPAFAKNSYERAITPRAELSAEERASIELFKQASPSVVYITSLTVKRDMFSMDSMKIPQGTGSGFVWDKSGHIVTNFHVIQTAQAAQVTLSDHTVWNATLVGAEPDKDIAVLRIETAGKVNLKPIPIGVSGDLLVGQRVFAIGNPFGLDYTLTTGVISALGREIESVTRRPIQGVIQTDASINPGNSGGPLMDSAGRLIGMNTAIYTPSGGGGSVGIGFAVPVDTINRIVGQLIAHGQIVKPALGITPAEDQLRASLGIDQGVLIIDVAPQSGAAKAGLRPSRQDSYGRVTLGDIIIAIDDKPVKKLSDLFKALDQYDVGDKIKVTVMRGGRKEQVSVALQKRAS